MGGSPPFGKTTVVTGVSPSGLIQYGHRFLETFAEFWPPSIGLQVYTETAVPMRRGTCHSLWECPGASEFMSRHKNNKAAAGKQQNGRWRPKDIARGYSYRFDALKFFKQLMIPNHAATTMMDGEILAWVDADVVTFKQVPDRFIQKLLGESELVFLGRRNTHSEIGFWAVKLSSRTRQFLAALAETYSTDRVFELPEWHSAYVFDHCRTKAKLVERNLTPNGIGHVWHQSALSQCTDHCKGERKVLGYSPERNA